MHPALEVVAADVHWVGETGGGLCLECDPTRLEGSEARMRRRVETWVEGLPDVEREGEGGGEDEEKEELEGSERKEEEGEGEGKGEGEGEGQGEGEEEEEKEKEEGE